MAFESRTRDRMALAAGTRIGDAEPEIGVTEGALGGGPERGEPLVESPCGAAIDDT
jgi:hypothetical protein